MSGTTQRRIITGLIVGVLAPTVVGIDATVNAAKSNTATQTAQSIWTDFKAAGSDSIFGYTDTETYGFNEAVASNYYTLSVTGPVMVCTGSSTNCASSNQPVIPEKPTPEPMFTMDRADECNFWKGAELTAVTKEPATTIGGLNGRGNWTFTWTYTWTPISVPAAETAWDLVETSSSGGASVTFTGRIAGLSAQKTSKSSAPKYSFSLLNSDGTPRLSNVSVTVDGGAAIARGSAVISAQSGEFSEFSIGSAGLVTLLAQSGMTSILTTGDAREILNADSFAGNDNGGSTGAALAFAQIESTKIQLTEGSHSIVLTANVKGIDGNTNVSISVIRGVRIQGLGNCG